MLTSSAQLQGGEGEALRQPTITKGSRPSPHTINHPPSPDKLLPSYKPLSIPPDKLLSSPLIRGVRGVCGVVIPNFMVLDVVLSFIECDIISPWVVWCWVSLNVVLCLLICGVGSPNPTPKANKK